MANSSYVNLIDTRMAFTRKPCLSLYSYVNHVITYKQDGAVSGVEVVAVGIFL